MTYCLIVPDFRGIGGAQLFILRLILGALFLAIPYGVKAVVIGHVISSIISFLINTYYPSKFYNYGVWNQIKDMGFILLLTGMMITAVFVISFVVENDILRLIVSIPLAGLIY